MILKFECFYVYDFCDIFFLVVSGIGLCCKIVCVIIKVFKWVMVRILLKKVFLWFIGGGGYYCIVIFDKVYVLNF